MSERAPTLQHARLEALHEPDWHVVAYSTRSTTISSRPSETLLLHVQWQMHVLVSLARALLVLAARPALSHVGFCCTQRKGPLAPQVTGLVADASTTALAGAPLSLAASSAASRRRRQLLDLTLAPQQVRVYMSPKRCFIR